jgi:N-acetyl-1-D-myo-inositol-2-amino-2-deoxy-alpha-D-glucopyranoside deacetylase
MMGLKENEHPRCFWQADVDDAAKLLLPVFDEVRPQVLVTYDTFGFYGHPDHIQAHRVATRAAEMAADAGIGPAKIYWMTVSRSSIERGFEAFRDSADNPFGDAKSIDDIPFGTPDEEITACVDGRAQSARKSAAIDAHASQIPADSWLRTVSGSQGADFLGVEYYILVRGEKGPGYGPYGWESDLFAGIA